MRNADWPPLPLVAWRPTYETVHRWTQIVGKIRMRFTPAINHWWHAALYVSPRGLTTSLIPYGESGFEIELDFVDHASHVRTADGETRSMPLRSIAVADFYRELIELLASLGIHAFVDPAPKELPDAVPYDRDRLHRDYDPEYAQRFARVLLQSHRALAEFRGRFVGKSSPVHFFWGSFDLCVTRFSGRRAPERPGADSITREAYSHEVISVGFWPGSGNVAEAAFYAYAAPEPAGFAEARLQSAAAYYNAPTKGFVLPYEAVRTAPDPVAAVLEFCESAYGAGADLAGWDRAALERRPGTSARRTRPAA